MFHGPWRLERFIGLTSIPKGRGLPLPKTPPRAPPFPGPILLDLPPRPLDRSNSFKFPELILHTLPGANFGPILWSFWDSIRVQKACKKQELILHLSRCLCWASFGPKFGYILVSCWRDWSREREFRCYTKTIKNQWFSMVLPSLRCRRNNEKPSRGEAASGLSTHSLNDTKRGPILIPKWSQNWSQNDIRNRNKINLRLMMHSGTRKAPQNGAKMGPDNSKMAQDGPRMAPGWPR